MTHGEQVGTMLMNARPYDSSPSSDQKVFVGRAATDVVIRDVLAEAGREPFEIYDRDPEGDQIINLFAEPPFDNAIEARRIGQTIMTRLTAARGEKFVNDNMYDKFRVGKHKF